MLTTWKQSSSSVSGNGCSSPCSHCPQPPRPCLSSCGSSPPTSPTCAATFQGASLTIQSTPSSQTSAYHGCSALWASATNSKEKMRVFRRLAKLLILQRWDRLIHIFNLLSFIALVKINPPFLIVDYLKLFASQEIEACSRWVYDHSVIQSSAVEVKIKSQNLPIGT